MASKVQLAKQGPLLGEVFSDDSDCENSPENAPNKGNLRASKETGSKTGPKRRVSSFGGARFKNEEEQTRIVGMYTNIIKLSSENKINEKNSWNLDLIDHMGKLIKADSSKQRGVNFQKASCTLDASVKIYANRVDDTYSHSHRVLESFSRTDTRSKADDSDDDEEGKPRRAARVGGNKASTRLNIGDTIEKNVDNINAKEIENDIQLDPMFHTISKLFDKGGTEGMLMQNLRCNPYSAAMALSQEGLPDPYTGEIDTDAFESTVAEEANAPLVAPVPLAEEEAAAAAPSSSCKPPTMLDLTDVVKAVNISMLDLKSLTICPQLNVYRAQIHNNGKDIDNNEVLDSLPTSGSTRVGSLNPEDFQGSHYIPAQPSEEVFTLAPSVHSLSRDIKLIPFSDMSDDMKVHTYANPCHAYYDAMAAMCTPQTSTDENGNEIKVRDIFSENEVAYDYTDAVCDDHDDDGGAGFDADDCDDDGNYVQSNRRASCMDASGVSPAKADATTGNTRQSMLQVGDVNDTENDVSDNVGGIQWDAVNGNVDITEAELLTIVPDKVTLEGVHEIITSGNNSTNNEYSYFDVNSMLSNNSKGANNDWAGAKHWKRAPSSRAAAQKVTALANDTQGEEDENSESTTVKKGKTKAKKAGVELELTEDVVFPSESLFKAPTGRGGSNTTLMTSAALTKQAEAAEDGELFLPLDSKLQPKDLCRLFMAEHIIVPPSAFSHMVKTKAALGFMGDQGEAIWGERAVASDENRFVNAPSLDAMAETLENDEECDYDDDAYFLQDGEAHNDDNIPNDDQQITDVPCVDSVESVEVALSGLAIDESKLVQVKRKVDKIDIGYSKTAKKINVKVLKTDMWREINDLNGGSTSAGNITGNDNDRSTHDLNDDNAPPAADFHATETGVSQIDKSSYCNGNEMSFQGLVNDLALGQKQKDVSVSFYFICLLHLANEKTLKLEDNEDMNDLLISKD